MPKPGIRNVSRKTVKRIEAEAVNVHAELLKGFVTLLQSIDAKLSVIATAAERVVAGPAPQAPKLEHPPKKEKKSETPPPPAEPLKVTPEELKAMAVAYAAKTSKAALVEMLQKYLPDNTPVALSSVPPEKVSELYVQLKLGAQ
jgi:hypothetical protein